METITIEKIIKFENIIDSIANISVNNELRYNVFEDDTHATGKINLTGSVNTILGKKDFNEDVDVDIYAPFDKKLDKDTFKINIKDYSYVVNNKNLLVYIILQIDGIVNDEKDDNKSIADEMNNLNEINEDETLIRNELEEVKVIEEIKDVELVEEPKEDKEYLKEKESKPSKVNIVENKKVDSVSSNWSSDIFKLNDSYVIFHRYKLK